MPSFDPSFKVDPLDQAPSRTQSSFDLELFAVRTLKDRGVFTSHGGSYFDPFQQKARQYDVRASIRFESRCMALLSVECKALAKTFPLIVSRVPRPEEDAYHEVPQTCGRKDSGEWFWGGYALKDFVGGRYIEKLTEFMIWINRLTTLFNGTAGIRGLRRISRHGNAAG